MNNLFNKSQKDGSKGFTLFEIAVTSVLIAIIASMALPNYRSVGEKTRSREGMQILAAIYQAQQLYMLENGGAVAGALGNLSSLEIAAATPSFSGPVLFTTNGQTAYIDRNNGNYRLYVNTSGDITCDDTPGWGGICAMMDIAPYPF